MAARIIGAIVTLPLLFFVPGFALLESRLFSEREMPFIERVLLVIVLSASISSLVALLLAEVGCLSVWLLDLVLVVVAVLVRLIFGRTKEKPLSGRPRRYEVLLLVVLALLCVVTFFRPAEYMPGEGDPGYYVNIGTHLARTGELNVYDESVPSMSDEEIETFYYTGIAQFYPFHLRDREAGRIQPLLFHLLSVWIGVFIMLFGVLGGLYVLPLFALLGMFAVYALARKFGGVFAAGIAVSLGAVFFLQVWFARVPNSEVFCQLFILASILFFIRLLEGGGVLVGLASALSIITASTARPEAMVVMVPMIAVMAVEMLRRQYRAPDYVFINSLLAGTACLLVYIRCCEFEYVTANFGKLISRFGRHATMSTVLTVGGFLVAAGFIFFNLRPLNRLLARVGPWLSSRYGRYRERAAWVVKAALALGTLATFAYAYRAVTPWWEGEEPLRIFFNTATFFGGIVVFVFVLALCLLILEADRIADSFLVAFTVCVLIFASLESTLALNRFPWDARRFMLLVVPMLFIGFGYLEGRLWKGQGLPGKRFRDAGMLAVRAAAVMLAVGALAIFIYVSWPILNHVEFRGSNQELVWMAEKMDDDVVIFTSAYQGEVIAMPLRYGHDVDARKIFKLDNAEEFAGIVRKYTDQGRKVLIEMSGVEADELPFDEGIDKLLDFEEAFTVSLKFPRLASVSSGRPRELFTQTIDLHFYYLEPKRPPPGVSLLEMCDR